jgi:hypothetical protein
MLTGNGTPAAERQLAKNLALLAAGVAVIAVLMMTMVLLPIAPLLPTPDDTAKTDITKPPKAH